MKDANAHGDALRNMLGIKRGDPKSRKLLRYMKKTDEHLIRVVDGGLNTRGNLVAAHMWCNSTRGDRSVKAHKEFINQTLEDGSHPLSALSGENK